jgi:hypothetical protein
VSSRASGVLQSGTTESRDSAVDFELASAFGFDFAVVFVVGFAFDLTNHQLLATGFKKSSCTCQKVGRGMGINPMGAPLPRMQTY